MLDCLLIHFYPLPVIWWQEGAEYDAEGLSQGGYVCYLQVWAAINEWTNAWIIKTRHLNTLTPPSPFVEFLLQPTPTPTNTSSACFFLSLFSAGHWVSFHLHSNMVVMLCKFGAYLYTGSAAMLSESVHSLADLLNQVSKQTSFPDSFFPICSSERPTNETSAT